MNDAQNAIVGKIPLYGPPSPKSENGNAGLYFDKFCEVLDPKTPGAKADWLKKFVQAKPQVGDADLIREHLERRQTLIEKQGGGWLRIKTAERFVTGLGYRHQVENGFAWHPVLGTPYLPGSGLKGLARAWAQLMGEDENQLKKIFGPRGDNVEHSIGSVIFLDAIPRQPVKLVVEVMTPHYGPYYQGSAPPADYHDPVPIPFLAVDKHVEFLAGVLPRTKEGVAHANQVMEWLEDALQELGAGAKTATGYGRFEVKDASTKRSVRAAEVTKDKPADPDRPAELTTLPAVFEVEFVDFVDAREARKTARERKKKGKEPKFREFDLRPTNPAFVKLAGKLVCSSRDTVGYDLPFEEAERHAGAARPFYAGKLEERDGKKVARIFSLTLPEEQDMERTMKVTHAELVEFSAFEHVRIEACTGINVFLGPNGCGKSHAMKAMYALIKTMEGEHSIDATETRLRNKLNAIFRPDGNDLQRLIRWGGTESKATVRVEGTSGAVSVDILPAGDTAVRLTSKSWETVKSAIFLPSGDLLAMSPGFVPLYQSNKISFDETYYDACVALQGLHLVGEELNLALELVKPIEEAIGGKVVLRGDRFYLESNGQKTEAHLLAEGYRKLAALMHLILNGSLRANSILFWDEPETNMNPRFVSVVVDVLVGLAKRGVQIFVTTHDYLLSHKFSLLSEYEKCPDVPIRFFAFYRNEEGDSVLVSPGKTLADLPDNPMLDEFAKHYDWEGELFDNRRSGS